MTSRVRVAAAVIVRGGRLFLAQRKAPRDFCGLWECPGGKVDAEDRQLRVEHAVAPFSDTAADRVALRRELREELGVESTIGDMICAFTINAPITPVDCVVTFYATEIVGEPELREHERFVWVDEEAVDYTLRDDGFHATNFPMTPAGELARAALVAHLRRRTA